MVYPAAVRVGNSPNSDPRRAAVNQVILHHTASTGDVEDIWNMFMQPNSRSVSANFLVAQDGRVLEVVNPDTRRAWTTGSGPGGTISPDHSAITLECMDSSGAPEWGQSPESCEAIAQVIAWAAKRYNFTPVRGTNVRGHREMPGQSTACPGGMPIDAITARANEILAGEQKPQPEEADVKQQFVIASTNGADPWYVTDGIYKRRLAAGEADILVQMNVAEWAKDAEGKQKTERVHIIGTDLLNRLIDTDKVIGLTK
jgi:hypothetical protein